jgi:hypothetical protein
VTRRIKDVNISTVGCANETMETEWKVLGVAFDGMLVLKLEFFYDEGSGIVG